MQVLIIGGGAAGAGCAARLRRLSEKTEIVIFEKTNEISIANCGLPYYCSGVIADRDKLLVSSSELFKNLFNIDVKLNTEIVSVNREKKQIISKDGKTYKYDKLVMAFGAVPIMPAIEGIENKKIFAMRTLSDADGIKNFVKNSDIKNAVVVGGGFIGVEMAENFIHAGLNTSLVELSSQILPPVDRDIACFVQNRMRQKGVCLYLNDGVIKFDRNNIVLNSGKKIPYDIAVISVGVKPDAKIAKDCGLKTGISGSIITNEFMQTSDADIFAAGDSVEVTDFVTGKRVLVPLAGPANRQGRIIADNIINVNKSSYKKTQGTAVVKVFDMTVASTGNNEKQLQESKIQYLKTHIWGNSHAGYYPGSYPVILKLLFTKDGKILGAQSAGYEGVEKRIDVISSVLRLNGTISDLIDSELSYAPPYSSAKDPVNIIGMNAENILKGYFSPAFYEDLNDSYIIDVRPELSFKINKIPNSVNIPAELLRNNLGNIPKNKKIVLYCAKGFTSYVASRILVQNGFDDVYSLSGGFMLFSEIVENKKGFLCANNGGSPVSKDADSGADFKIDVCGMQCPGPIMKLSDTIKKLNDGQTLEVSATDAGFMSDVRGWCATTGNILISVNSENKIIKAVIRKEPGGKNAVPANNAPNGQTIVVFSGDLDKVIASMIIANGAAASGKNVVLFFTFWGLNALRKSVSEKKVNKNIIEKVFSLMMPKGPDKLKLSKMNMFGLGTIMMKFVMKSKNMATLQNLISDAQKNGVRFIACSMSMDVMGIKKEELMDGIEVGGVANYISESGNANSNLFI